jgi:signal transduction histidine kinase
MSITRQKRLLAYFAGVFLAIEWSTVALAEQIPQPKPESVSAPSVVPGSQWEVGSWMWDQITKDGQECHFWRTVEIPLNVTVSSAKLRIAADNFFTLYVDGQQIGSGSDWRMLIEYDLTELFTPGTHVLAIKGVNDFFAAGVLMGLHVKFTNGRSIEVVSDAGWRVVPVDEPNWTVHIEPQPTWKNTKIVGEMGTFPWVERSGERTVFKAPLSHRVIIPFWHQHWFYITEAVLFGLLMAVCLYLMIRLVMQSQMQFVIQRERSRIARDVHDDLTAWLTRLVLLGERAQKDLSETSPVRGQVHEMCENSRSLLAALNQTIWVINSKRDTLQDLVSYVCRYAESFFQSTPIRCRFDVEDGLPIMSCDVGVRRNLFLAVKESLNNVLRHSVATEVTLRIQRHGGKLMVSIEDNGKGFVPEQADEQRNGLSNMKDRAADANGSCQIISKPGDGCRVEFRIPLQPSHRRSFQSLFLSKHGRTKNLANQTSAQSPSQAAASSTSANENKSNT